MCALCVEFEKGKLTKFEVQQALIELIQTNTIEPEHIQEIIESLFKEDL